MNPEVNMEKMDHLIQEMKRIAWEVELAGGEIPAVARNVKRLMASIKMLEINVSDVSGIVKTD